MRLGSLIGTIGAICVLLAGSSTGSSAQGNLAQAVKKLLLIFPVDVTSASVPAKDEMSQLMTDVAVSRAVATKTYSVTQFYRGQPSITRLHNDQQLTDADLQEPFSEDNRKPVKIAKLIGYDVALVGSLDDYQFTDNQVTVTVSGRLIEVETGRVIKTVVKNGASAKGGTAKEDEKALEAGRAAAESVMADLFPLTGPVQQAAPTPTPKAEGGKKKRSAGWLIGLLVVGLGVGIGLAAGGGGGRGGALNPPSPPY